MTLYASAGVKPGTLIWSVAMDQASIGRLSSGVEARRLVDRFGFAEGLIGLKRMAVCVSSRRDSASCGVGGA